MWCRALLTILTISYLICTLLLSGLQKEDLDVNMLRKLQRHNVNIDDMNNEDLRHECLSTSTADITNYTTGKDINNGKNEHTTEVDTLNQNIKNSDATDLDTVVKYFAEIRIPENQFKKEEIDTSSKKQTGQTEINFDASIKNNYYTNKNEHETGIKYANADTEDHNKVELDKIMEILNTFTRRNINNKIIKTIPDVTPENFTNTNVVKNNNNEIENISKIIAEYITNTQTTTPIQTYSSTSPTVNLDIQSISRHIERFLGNNPISEKVYPYNTAIVNINKENASKLENNNNNKHMPTETVNIFRNDYDTKRFDKINSENQKRKGEKNNEIKNIADILRANGQLRIYEPFLNYTQRITEAPYFSGISQQRDSDIKIFEQHKESIKPSNDVYAKLEKENEKKKEAWKPFPSDTIKEIAERVKVMVLKDLQKEIYNATLQVTTISTTEPTTAKVQKHDQENIQEAPNVIEKFMALFQQFKSMTESTIISGNTKYKMTEQQHVKQEYNGPVKIIYPPPVPPVKPFETIGKVEPMPPILINQYHPDFQVNTPVHNFRYEKQNTVKKLPQLNILNPKAVFRVTPITLQTNSDEIPPLGIPISPISNPVKLMNQNIIVTTKRPFLKTRNDRPHHDYLQRGGNENSDNNEMRNNYERPKTYAKSTHHVRESERPSRNDYKDSYRDGIRFTNINRDTPKYNNDYNERAHYASYNYKPRHDRSDFERLRSQDIKSFHEKLERVDNWNRNSREGEHRSDETNRYKVSVPSRQQLSLNTRSRYDDTHFRNFLKTQQKVNDMLERILATKTSQGPQIVEVP